MTLNKAAWAIDGPLISASLARTESYDGSEGIVAKGDLRVSALDVPGQGVQIAGGAASILNAYQTNPNQAYTITNTGAHVVGSALMPAAAAAQRTFIVAIAVGDPEFSQAGHPFMLASDPPDGEEATFEYVRPIVVLESDFNARSYPALALARLVIPANTTVIQNSMLTDLRRLARPRTKVEIAHVEGPGADNNLNGGGGTPGTFERFPNVGVLTVAVPSWAVKAKVSGFIEGVKLSKNGSARFRAYVEGSALATASTNANENNAGSGNERRSYNIGGEIDIRNVAGQTRTFSVEGTPVNEGSKGAFIADGSTSIMLQVYFEEQPT